MVSQVAVIYSRATSRIRRVFGPDDDSDLAKVVPGRGEDVIFLPIGTANLQEEVNRRTGRTPAGDRFAVVDAGGSVVNAILADPACGDAVCGHRLIAHPTADKGWSIDVGTGKLKRSH